MAICARSGMSGCGARSARRRRASNSSQGPVSLPACPLMHGTGFVTASTAMLSGGCVVTVDNLSLDSHAIWSAVLFHRVQGIAIVGDPFDKPLLKALDENPGKYLSLIHISEPTRQA